MGAKNHGIMNGKRTAGFICSIIGLCIDAVYFLYCAYLLMVVGSLAAALELKRSIEVKKTIVWILVIIVTFAVGFGF